MLFIKLKQSDIYNKQKKILKESFELLSKMVTDKTVGDYSFKSFTVWNTVPITNDDYKHDEPSNVMYQGNEKTLKDCLDILDEHEKGSIVIEFHVDYLDPKWQFDILLYIERDRMTRFCDYHIYFDPYVSGQSCRNLLRIPKMLDHFHDQLLNPLLQSNRNDMLIWVVGEDIPNFR